MSEHDGPRVTGVHTVGVPVTDQDRAVGFYTGTLGMEKRADAPLPGFGGRWIEVAPRGAAVTIALVPARESVPAGVETGIRLTTADAGALHAVLTGGGVDAGEVLRWDGVPAMFEFRDPDGNTLEIVETAAETGRI
ncbi:VOC family protein [Spongiactinospora sp. TRM90649]|uniref:VOC family protein n=1 Tax=Spongiactinospora sp. TRM90649 TaxID=3031114 RepID=UPI0023F75435|nr:VOC family protein [Spongiactinospora sp. TRM90649]MDF5754296.1 VOC family protein [Spongiactinospora sp. TRM90649]